MSSINKHATVIVERVKAAVEAHGYTLEGLEFQWSAEYPTWRMRTRRGGLTTSVTASSADELLELFESGQQQTTPGGPW